MLRKWILNLFHKFLIFTEDFGEFPFFLHRVKIPEAWWFVSETHLERQIWSENQLSVDKSRSGTLLHEQMSQEWILILFHKSYISSDDLRRFPFFFHRITSSKSQNRQNQNITVLKTVIFRASNSVKKNGNRLKSTAKNIKSMK